MANQKHLSQLRKGVTAWNRWRAQNHGVAPVLIGADLDGVNLNGLNANGADLNGAKIAYTSFSDVDLSQARGLASVVHDGPSSIGVDTLVRTLQGSGGQFTEEGVEFFVVAGVPHTLLKYLQGLLQAEPLQFYKCFISYGSQDEAFAQRLNQDLNGAGVKTWKWNLLVVAQLAKLIITRFTPISDSVESLDRGRA